MAQIDLNPRELKVLHALITFHGEVFVRDCLGHVEALGLPVPEDAEGRRNFREYNKKALDDVMEKLRRASL